MIILVNIKRQRLSPILFEKNCHIADEDIYEQIWNNFEKAEDLWCDVF